MPKLKEFAVERPVLFSVVIIFLSIIFTEIPLRPLLEPSLGLRTAHYLVVVLEQSLVGLAVLWLVARLGWLISARVTTSLRQWRALGLSWPVWLMTLFVALEFFAGGSVIDTSQPAVLLLHLLAALSVGWMEEILMRGLVLTTYLKKWGHSRQGIYGVVLFSSILFGLMHLANFFAERKPWLNSLSQVVMALFFGVFFAACILRNRSIWPMVLLHAAFDWAATLPEIAMGGQLRLPGLVTQMTVLEALTSALFALPLFLYGLFILREVAPADLDETPWEERPIRSTL